MDVRERLAQEIEVAGWSDLAPHHARGAVLLCDGALGLLDAALALAADDVPRVGAWVASGLLRKPVAAEGEAFLEAGSTFRFLIVQPFVVIREETAPPG